MEVKRNNHGIVSCYVVVTGGEGRMRGRRPSRGGFGTNNVQGFPLVRVCCWLEYQGEY